MIYSYLFLAFAVVFLVLVKGFYPYYKGKFGEWFISFKLKQLDPARFTVLNDILLPSQGSTTYTQIDHIVISNGAIYCIETKDHSGKIFGSIDQDLWTLKTTSMPASFSSSITNSWYE